MLVTPSSSTLNATLLTSGTTSGNIHSARAYPFPALRPLSTRLAPPPDLLSNALPPHFRSSWPSELSSTMPPSGASGYSTQLGTVDPSSQSNPSVVSTSVLSEPTAYSDTSAGTSAPPPSASSSNSGVSAPLTSLLATSGLLTSSWAASSSSSPSYFTDPSSTTPSSVIPFPIPLTTRPVSSPASVSSSSSFSTFFPSSATTQSLPEAPDSTTTVFISTTVVTSVSLPTSSPLTSTQTVTSILPGQAGTVTDIVTSSASLSTESPGSTLVSTGPISPGTIAAIVLGIAGTLAFAALWLFCARRRHRKLVQEAALAPPANHAMRPLDDEIPGVDELGYGIESIHSTENATGSSRLGMEERYAGILAALHLSERIGRGNEGGSTGGVYGSRHDADADGDDDITRASSPTLPIQPVPLDDSLYPTLLSPPPPTSYQQTTQPTPPSSAYHTSRRRSSPGPDAVLWTGGHSVAPSCKSYYAGSQTLGSGSISGSVDALTRTRTGSEEPLLGIGKATREMTAGRGVSPTILTDPGSSKLGLGSAFGSPAGSMYSPGSIYPALQHDSSGSYDARSGSGSGSYGYARSATPSSFDVLRSVSSQGALSNAYDQSHSHGQGFRFGFGSGSTSSASTGKKVRSSRHSFGVPPTSFKGWKDWGSASDKEKQSLREKASREKNRTPTSTSRPASMDEKQGRASPVVGVRTLFDRLRRGTHTPSPRSPSNDLPSPIKASALDADPEKAIADQVTPPPIQVQTATPHRRRFSFILSNPDPHPPSPYSGAGDVLPNQEVHQQEAPTPRDLKMAPFNIAALHPALVFPTDALMPIPSPAPTEDSRLVEGLLHPRLRAQGCSDASLRDFEDYSRPIGGIVKNRLYSTTTFGTQDDIETKSRGTPVQDVMLGDEHESDAADVFGASTPTGIPHGGWLFSDPSSRHSPPKA